MVSSSDSGVLALVINEEPSPGLSRTALRHGWPLLREPVTTRAYALLMRRKPRVVILQISPQPNGELDLIRLLRSDVGHISLIAIASVHHEGLERAVRNAGVGCYLPSAADTDHLGHVVTEVLDRDQRQSPAQVGRYRSPKFLSLPTSAAS